MAYLHSHHLPSELTRQAPGAEFVIRVMLRDGMGHSIQNCAGCYFVCLLACFDQLPKADLHVVGWLDDAVEGLVHLGIIGILAQRGQVAADGLLGLHDDECDSHEEDDNTPLEGIHRGHTEDDLVEAWDVGDGDLETGHDTDGVPADWVSSQDAWVEAGVVGEASGEGDADGTEGESVEGLGALFLEVVSLSLDPEDGSDGGGDKDDGGDDDAEEEEASDDALSDHAWLLVHDTILSWFDGGDESKGDGTDQVTVEDLDWGEWGIIQTAKETEEDGHSLGVVDWSVDEEDLAEVVPDDTTLTDSGNDGGEVIIGEDHLGSLAGDIGSFLAHGDSHIGGLQSWGVVHTISGHTGDFSLGLEGLDDLDLVLWRGAGENVVLLDGLEHLLLGEGIEFWSGNGIWVLGVDESELVSDCEGGILVISGDHGNTDSGTVGNSDGVNAFWARWVHDSAKSDNCEPWLGAFVDESWLELGTLLDLALVSRSAAQGQHTKSMGAEHGDLIGPKVHLDWFLVFLSEHTGLGLVLAKLDHAVWGSLGVDDILSVVSGSVVLWGWLVHGGHELVLGGEWDFGDDWGFVLHATDIDVGKVGGAEDGQFSWVSDLAFASTVDTESALGAEDTASEGVADEGEFWRLAGGDWGGIIADWLGGGGRLAGGLGGSATGSALAEVEIIAGEVGDSAVLVVDIELVMGVGGDEGDEGHFVLGEGSGLVGADGGNGSEGLDGWKGADDGVLLGHVADSPGVGDGDDGLESLWDHGDGAHEGDGEGVEEVVLEGEHGDAEGDDGSDDDEDGQVLGDGVDLLEHGGLLLFDLRHEGVDGSNLGEVTGGDDEAGTGSLGDEGGGEAHVVAVSEWDLLGVLALDLCDLLVDWHGLTGEGGLGAGKVADLNHAKVGWDTVSQAEHDDVSWDDEVSGDLGLLPVTDDDGVGRKHGLEGLGGLLGGTLLDDSDGGVDSNYANNDGDLDGVGDWIIGEDADG
mmetsp:Transcript_14088/g.38770  ORF Transcript_14088/g.38770 Transcript_14088/m.38770 type:complete len:974 (+) Transcript_14088:288-3209(+)